MPEHAHGPDYARHLIGSGPYQLVQWDERQPMIVEANSNYYGEAPGLKQRVFLFTEEDGAVAAAKAGQPQRVSMPPSLAVQTIEDMTLPWLYQRE